MIRIFLFALLVTCFLLRCKQESHSLKVPFLSSANIKVDGKLNEGGWSEAGKIDRLTEFFLQEESHDQTEVYLLYDSVHLYIGAKIYNGYIEGSLKERDSEIYKEHCFEFFLDPNNSGTNYYEFEINALGTVWDLKLKSSERKALANRNNVDEWHLSNMNFAVHVTGTVNDPSDVDEYWSAEIAIPWDSLQEKMPQKGSSWRANFMRVDQGESENKLYAWCPTGTKSIHVPEKWGFIRF